METGGYDREDFFDFWTGVPEAMSSCCGCALAFRLVKNAVTLCFPVFVRLSIVAAISSSNFAMS